MEVLFAAFINDMYIVARITVANYTSIGWQALGRLHGYTAKNARWNASLCVHVLTESTVPYIGRWYWYCCRLQASCIGGLMRCRNNCVSAHAHLQPVMLGYMHDCLVYCIFVFKVRA